MMISGATFIETIDDTVTRHRLALWRIWDTDRPFAMFIGVNPSVADAEVDDQTITRCIDFTPETCGGLVMANLFSLVSPDPVVLRSHSQPLATDNDKLISDLAGAAEVIICAWGRNGNLKGRDRQVLEILAGRELLCLGINADGSPKHPSRLPKNTPLIHFLKPLIKVSG